MTLDPREVVAAVVGPPPNGSTRSSVTGGTMNRIMDFEAISMDAAISRLRAHTGQVVHVAVKSPEDSLEVGPTIGATGPLYMNTERSKLFGPDAFCLMLGERGGTFQISGRGETLTDATIARAGETAVHERLRLVVGGLELVVTYRRDGEPFDHAEAEVP